MSDLVLKEYICEKCNFKCSKKFSWNRHLSTNKHLKITKNDQLEKNKSYTCGNCNKLYTSRNGLWFHKKKCQSKPTEKMLVDIIIELVKTNTELTNKLKTLEDIVN